MIKFYKLFKKYPQTYLNLQRPRMTAGSYLQKTTRSLTDRSKKTASVLFLLLRGGGAT